MLYMKSRHFFLLFPIVVCSLLLGCRSDTWSCLPRTTRFTAFFLSFFLEAFNIVVVVTLQATFFFSRSSLLHFILVVHVSGHQVRSSKIDRLFV